MFYKCGYWFFWFCFLGSRLHAHTSTPNWIFRERTAPPATFSPLPLSKALHTSSHQSLNKTLCSILQWWKLLNWETMLRESMHIPKWTVSLIKRECFCWGKKREKKNWGEGNKAVPLIIWKPWQSQAGCNNLCEPSALSTAVSSLLPAPTFCCFPPGSHHVIPKPSREITEEKPLERQQATTLTWSRVITLIKILVELVNRNKWLAKK